jgi:hypothetical protein
MVTWGIGTAECFHNVFVSNLLCIGCTLIKADSKHVLNICWDSTAESSAYQLIKWLVCMPHSGTTAVPRPVFSINKILRWLTVAAAADWLNIRGLRWLKLSTKQHDSNMMPSFQTTGSFFKIYKAICAFKQQHKSYFTFACQKPNDQCCTCCHCFEQIGL